MSSGAKAKSKGLLQRCQHVTNSVAIYISTTFPSFYYGDSAQYDGVAKLLNQHKYG